MLISVLNEERPAFDVRQPLSRNKTLHRGKADRSEIKWLLRCPPGQRWRRPLPLQ